VIDLGVRTPARERDDDDDKYRARYVHRAWTTSLGLGVHLDLS